MTKHDVLPVLLMDGECSLCNRSVWLILRLEGRPALSFAALGSPEANRLIERYATNRPLPDSVVLIDHTGVYTKSSALIRIGIIAGGWLGLLQVLALMPRKWTDKFYDFVASNRRRWFGRTSYCQMVKASDRHRFIDL